MYAEIAILFVLNIVVPMSVAVFFAKRCGEEPK